jgi:hypothetical protein
MKIDDTSVAVRRAGDAILKALEHDGDRLDRDALGEHLGDDASLLEPALEMLQRRGDIEVGAVVRRLRFVA